MLSAAVVAAITFVIVFLGLRLIEVLFHRMQHTADWSPHWGSWVFALLAGIFVFVSNLGR